MNSDKKFEISETTEASKLLNKIEPPQPKISLAKETNQSEAFSELDLTKVGQKIAEVMEELDYHPVIIFGSSNSGKSSLLGSLLSYFQIDTTHGIGIYLGDSLIPTSTPHGKWAYSEAESFFYKSIQEFLDGTAHAATKSRHPFFIPIKINPPNLPEIKFAFMESNGEWYKPQKDTGRYFPELKEEINAILKHYQRGISFIHLAPYTQINAWVEDQNDTQLNKEEINDASLALVGALNSYEQLRVFKSDDAHMFLITKWDASAKQNVQDQLQNVDVANVEAVANNLYTKGFAAFNNLSIELNQKNIMQYSSGIISGRSIIKSSPNLKPILNRYPQTMWNWLYGNATDNNSEINNRLVLIPKPIVPKKSFFDNLNNLITRILK
jgi:hypothetical protein